MQNSWASGLQTPPDSCNSYVPEGLAQVRIKYAYGWLYVSETESSWNASSQHSETPHHNYLLPVLLPRSLILPPLSKSAFIPTRKIIHHTFQKNYFNFCCFFYDCLSVKLYNFKFCNLKLYKSGSVHTLVTGEGSFQNQKLLRIVWGIKNYLRTPVAPEAGQTGCRSSILHWIQYLIKRVCRVQFT